MVNTPAMPSTMRRSFSRGGSLRQDLAMIELAVHERGDHQRQADHHAGDDAGQEQRRDRHVAGDVGEHDHADRRRDDRAHGGGGEHDGGGEAAAVAVLLHGRDHHRADRGDFGDRRSGDAAEEHRGDADDLRQAAGQPADQNLGHHHEALGDAAARHQGAGEDEEDHRQQREGVDRGQHALDDRGVVDARQQQGGDHGGDADRERRSACRAPSAR